MADVALAAASNERLRKERVHTTMLVELLALLVFMSMAFAFVLREEDLRVNPLQEKVERLERELREKDGIVRQLRPEVRALQKQIEMLESSLRRLVARHNGPLPASDLVTLPKSELQKLAAQLANAEAIAKEKQDENVNLRGQLADARGGKGVGRPTCVVTSSFLLSFQLLADGSFRGSPAWHAGAADQVAKIPGVRELASGAPLSRQAFISHAAKVDGWAKKQDPACAFRAQVRETHGDLTLYKRQVSAVEQYFYVRRN